MMEIFDILFSVRVSHSYFKNGVCPDIAVVPDHNTSRLIRKYGLVFRATPFGFNILSECSKHNKETYLSGKVEADLQLNFFLILKNPYLLNITKMNEPNPGSLLFFTNESIDTDPDINGSFSFKLGNHISLAAQFIRIDSGSGDSLHLEKGENSIVIKALPGPDSSNFPVTRLEDGVYNNRQKTGIQYYYITNQSFIGNPFALLSIEMKDDHIVDSDRKMQKAEFLLKFEAIETYWQYILNVNQKHENLVIESSGNTEEFEQSEIITSDNTSAIRFTSKNKLPVSQFREDYFKLKLRNGDPANDLILISKLPLPDLSVLIINSDGKTYSPIYVNF